MQVLDGHSNSSAALNLSTAAGAPPVAVQTNLKRNLVYNIAYENVLYCFFVFLGPLVILTVLNAGLIRELLLAKRRLRERHLPASAIGPEQGEHSLTLVGLTARCAPKTLAPPTALSIRQSDDDSGCKAAQTVQ